MRLGRPKSTNKFVFSMQKVDPSSSSSSGSFSSSSSSIPACQPDPSQTILHITSGNVVNGLGMTFASSDGNKFYHNSITDYDGLPNVMRIYVSGVEAAVVTWNQPYSGTSFVFEKISEGVSTLFCGNIVSGEINF